MIVGTNFRMETFGKLIKGKLSAEKFERKLVKLIRAGTEYIELSGDLVKALEEGFSRNKEIIRSVCKKHGISLGLHLPTFGFALESWFENSRKGIVKDAKELITKDYAPIEFENFVLHMHGIESYLRIGVSEGLARDKSEFKKLLLKSLEKVPKLRDLVNFDYFVIKKALQGMIKSLKELETFLDIEKVCFENSESIQHKYYCSILDRLMEVSNLSICLDVGHLKIREILEGRNYLLSFLEKYHRKIREVHIHNVKILSERRVIDHQSLADSGEVNLKKTLKSLKDFGFKGPIVLELPYSDSIRSLKVLSETLKQL